MALEGTVHTPLGVMQKKTVVFAGVGLAGILGIAWYRSKQSQAAATAADATSTDTSQTDGQYPDQGYASSDYSGLSYDQYGNPQYTGGGYVPGPPPVPGPGSFTSNAQWAQYVEQYMVDNTGADPAVVGNALGKYITGQPVTADQAQVIDQAIAFGGYPPIAGTNGNPPGIVNLPPSGGGGKQAHNPVAGLHTTKLGFNNISVAWDKSQNAKSYLVTTSTGGRVVNRKTVTGTTINIPGLKKRTSYTIKVHAGPSNNPATAQISAKTKG